MDNRDIKLMNDYNKIIAERRFNDCKDSSELSNVAIRISIRLNLQTNLIGYQNGKK